ncbi:MAG: STM4011 family radical SAM protein [Zavarzinella sp.]
MTALSILYRGPLSSCNYGCEYCPFAKHRETEAELAHDRECLERFVLWCESNTERPLRIFFTPWGEALIRQWYRTAMVWLSQMRHVQKVACQTNLSYSLDWLKAINRETTALWCTYHPGETKREKFVEKINKLSSFGIAHSVGIVGLKEHMQEATLLRTALPTSTYVWVNAYKRVANYYSTEERAFWTAIDPHFETNNQYHTSFGEECTTGSEVISVDGTGNVQRCHFVKETLGNLYQNKLSEILRITLCPNEKCGCYIGYVHLEKLDLAAVYGERILERIPLQLIPEKVQILPATVGNNF